MAKDREFVKNVADFLERASDLYGRMKAERFSQDMFSQIIEGYATHSPIEDLFYIAMHVMGEASYVEVNPEPEFDEKKGEWKLGYGIHVHTQYKIGKYRVDFLVSSTDGPQPNQVIVELDGHDFHDKDKHQRAYEKARDRYLTRCGYRILHYTGSEIVADPFKAAHEVLSVLGGLALDEYDSKNPVGME